MKHLIPVFAIAALLAGCADGTKALSILDTVRETGEMVADKVLDAGAKAVDAYGNKTPDKVKETLREGINSRTDDWDILIVPSK